MVERASFRMKCDTTAYRKCFIEVTPGVHTGCINIETWQIHPEKNIREISWVTSSKLSDSDIISNTEIELTLDQAQKIATALQAAAGPD